MDKLQISDGDVAEVLGLVDRRIYEDLARALLAADLAACLDIFTCSQAAGMDLKRFASDLLGFFRALLIVKIKPQPEELLDLSDQELAAIQDIAAGASQETLYQYFSLLLKGSEEMQYSSRPRLALEMAFVRATQAGQVVPTSTLLARLDGLLAGVVLPQSAARPAFPSISTAEPAPSAPRTIPLAAVSPVATLPEEKMNNLNKVPISLPEQDGQSPPALTAAAPADREVTRHWEEFLRHVRARKRWMAPVLQLCTMVSEKGDELILEFATPFDCKLLQEPDNLKLLQQFAQKFFQREFRVVIRENSAQATGESENNETESLLVERRTLGNDPLVQMTTEIFGGQIGNIRPGLKV